jgi:hypothetical protein
MAKSAGSHVDAGAASSDDSAGTLRPTLMMASKKSDGRPHSEFTKIVVTLRAMARRR